MAPDDEADLLHGDVCLPLGDLEHFEDDEQVVAVVVQFGPLIGVEDVFQHQGVQVQAGPQCLQVLGVAEAVDVDPGDGVPGRDYRAAREWPCWWLRGSRVRCR